ncbi:MAG: fumarate hydratase class II [Shewanella sp.]|jgi:fumarate hydratase class II
MSKTSKTDALAKVVFAKINVPKDVFWGEQTQRSLTFFNIGSQHFDLGFIKVLVSIKRACATINYSHSLLSIDQLNAILFASDEILQGDYGAQFPLHIWQTGSGTQTNMNVNEVISHLANNHLAVHADDLSKGKLANSIHPNDHVNLSQSSNDVFPTAMHIIVAQQTQDILLPAIELLEREFASKVNDFDGVYTVGRTHLMDALPIKVSCCLSAYMSQLAFAKQAIQASMEGVYHLALGGTALGSGANAPSLFGQQAISILAKQYQLPFIQSANLYAAVSGEDALLRYSNSLKQLAAVLLKVANDFRLLGSGPRCGLNEWLLPANEPGSSIMPGKVNPTQCEALSMVCLQVFGNDLTVSLASSNGQLQLNTYRPVIIHNVLESIGLLSDAMTSFANNCVSGLQLNQAQIDKNMSNNLSVITLLMPIFGYDKATQIVQTAAHSNITLAEAAEQHHFIEQKQFQMLLQKQLDEMLAK